MTAILSALPERIVFTLEREGMASEFLCAIKTTVKPNETIPTLWLVCTENRLLLCSTHKTRGIYKRFTWSSLNDVRKIGAPTTHARLEIIQEDIDLPDEFYPIDPSVSTEDIEYFLKICRKQRLNVK